MLPRQMWRPNTAWMSGSHSNPSWWTATPPTTRRSWRKTTTPTAAALRFPTCRPPRLRAPARWTVNPEIPESVFVSRDFKKKKKDDLQHCCPYVLRFLSGRQRPPPGLHGNRAHRSPGRLWAGRCQVPQRPGAHPGVLRGPALPAWREWEKCTFGSVCSHHRR